jgi:hypothetical protein
MPYLIHSAAMITFTVHIIPLFRYPYLQWQLNNRIAHLHIGDQELKQHSPKQLHKQQPNGNITAPI